MEVKNYKEKCNYKTDCLFDKFGKGVHLIRKTRTKEFSLLVICNNTIDALFIEEDMKVSHQPSDNNEINYARFDEFYEYIKKLDLNELVVELK